MIVGPFAHFIIKDHANRYILRLAHRASLVFKIAYSLLCAPIILSNSSAVHPPTFRMKDKFSYKRAISLSV